METRIKYGTLALFVFLPFLYYGGLPFALFTVMLGLIGMYELARMANIQITNPVLSIVLVAVGLMILPNQYLHSLLGTIDSMYLFYFLCLLLLILTVFLPKYINFTTAAILGFGGIYIGSGFHFFTLIREMGLETILYLLAVIWMTDIGAFFVGSAIGKHKLAPEISPNKTIEGFVGGVVMAVLATNVLFFITEVPIPLVEHRWVLTVMLSIFGQLGDLVESAYKRHFNVKDSGNLIPGHGGVLDRFDSTLFASIMFMIFLNLYR